MAGAGFSTSIDVRPRQSLPHYRRLVVCWDNSTELRIGLDQGLGYWMPRRHHRFPFTATAPVQTTTLASAEIVIAARDAFPTILYLYPLTNPDD